jgi:hypothetical protein
MTAEQFKKANNLRGCEKCCSTCRNGRDLLDDGVYQCVHVDVDKTKGLFTYADQVCDKWEKR